MSFEIPGQTLGVLVAGEDLSGAQYLFMKLHGATGRVIKAGAGEASIGVLQNKPSSGHACEIDRNGVSKVQFAATMDAGVQVTPDTNGKAVAATTSNWVAGITLEPITNAAQIGAVALDQSGKA